MKIGQRVKFLDNSGFEPQVGVVTSTLRGKVNVRFDGESFSRAVNKNDLSYQPDTKKEEK